MAKIRVALLFGGRSAEHEVSLVSATSILGALDPSRYDVTLVAVDADGRWHLGDPTLPPILATLESSDYSGWLVVEQDIMPGPGDPANAHQAQIANRALLRTSGF